MAQGKLTQALVDLEQGLQAAGRSRALAALRPGLEESAVRAQLDAAALPADRQLQELYAWRDGVSIPPRTAKDDFEIFPGFYFDSLEDAITNYRAFLESAKWSVGWLPILADAGGDFYLVDTTQGSAVRHFMIDETEQPIEYASIGDFFATIAEGFRRGVIFTDDQGYLNTDYAEYESLAARLNPSVGWWQS